ncbi:MAG: hypothetical protein IH957_11875 [Chloroflexi bacterium]|nr:hypothetical protein [Chloroflexota bacterium]
MNETNRSIIVLVAGLWIMLMAILIFMTWSANTDVINGLFDAVEYFEDHNDDAGRLIVTLGALILAVLATLVIILELAPEDEEKELKIRQAGATTIVPAQALRARLEEALTALPDVTAARARVSSKDDGVAATLDVTVTPTANLGHVTQESTRVVVDAIQQDLGLPVKGVPTVRISFGGPKVQPVASSATQPPPSPTPSPQTPTPPPVPTSTPEPSDWLPGTPDVRRPGDPLPASEPSREEPQSQDASESTSDSSESGDRPQP